MSVADELPGGLYPLVDVLEFVRHVLPCRVFAVLARSVDVGKDLVDVIAGDGDGVGVGWW